MQAVVKNALESSLVAALVAVGSFWLLVSATSDAELAPSTAKVVLLALGLAMGLIAHWAYMCLALRKAGRSLWRWVPLLLLLPLGSVAAWVVLQQEGERQAAAPAQRL